MQKSAQIKVTDQFGAKRTLSLTKALFTIGRKPENDLQLLSGSVSRHHAEIVYEGDTYFIVDKGSKSGTFVNDQQVSRRALVHLDRISIGGVDDCQMQFIEEAAMAAAVAANTQQSSSGQSSDQKSASANEELQKLIRFVEVNQAFKFSLSPDDVLCLIVDAAIEITKGERGFLMLKNENGELEFKVARDNQRNWLQGNDFAMSHSVVEECFKFNRSVILNDSIDNSPLASRQSIRNLDLRTIACVPLFQFKMTEKMDATSLMKRDVLGVLYVDSRLIGGVLSKTSLTLMESLAFEAVQSLESVRLMREEQEKQRLEREFTMAQEVQMALLPTSFKPPDYFEVAGQSIPTRYVGGDFYDLITLDDGRAAFVLGDVSGKGISAALLASMAQGVLQAQLFSGLPLDQVVTTLNRVVVKNSAANRFITLFCALLDREGNFTFVNAGHNPPILVRANGQTELLSSDAIVVGAFDFAEYKSAQIKIGKGDIVVVFTDGVTEAVDAQNEMFGDDRLEALIKSSSNLSAEEIKDIVFKEVLAYTRGLPQGDDITMIALKMK